MSSNKLFNPIILNYKTFSCFIQEKEDGLTFECTNKHIIHTAYNPRSEKGCKLTAKVLFSANDRIGSKDNGLNCHYSLHSELGWFINFYESETGLSIDLITGQQNFTFENTTKLVSNIKQYTLTAKIFTNELI